MTRSSAVAVSAPAKVLLAGGYLVLDRKHTGLVFGLSARIHVHVQPVRTSVGVVLSQITVRSPQFLEAVWEYGFRLSPGHGGVQVTELRADADLKLKRNVFIETALAYALTYITSVEPGLIAPTNVGILADNDYYSTSGLDIAASERFHNFAVPIGDAHKTGLGSSAALVTAFTAGLLQYYLPREVFDIGDETSRRRLHNLAQAAHCAAQGKVGSGFDVASAVYGSCVYRRFSPAILEELGDPASKHFATRLRHIVEETTDDDAWDTEVIRKAVKVPAGLRLVMCDVKGGSQTPGMVKAVLAWRKQNQQAADALWSDLQTANDDLARALVALAEQPTKGHDALQGLLLRIRSLIRDMSHASGVPIEPPEQTKLIDACSAINGVLGGVVPGAGGHDAIALLIEDRSEVLDELSGLLSGWSGRVGLLRVREEMEGIRIEDGSGYKTWLS